MTRKEFTAIVQKAERGCLFDTVDKMWELMQPLEGIALHNERRMVSEAGAITFIRYQAMQLNGSWDYKELEDCQHYFKRVDIC